VEPKGKGKRVIPLPKPLVIALKEHRTKQERERLRAGEEWADLDLAFALWNGQPINPREDWEEWKAVLNEAGVRDARLHDARHTAATMLLEQGMDIRVV
jgi:site-specific recombinase XerD